MLLCLVLIASLAGVSACGGDDDEDVTALLAQTFGGEGKDVDSGRLDANLRIDTKGLANVNGPITLRLAGPFASTEEGKLPRFDFTFAFNAGGQAIEAGAVSTGDKGFLRFQGQAYDVGEELFKQFRDGYAQQAKCAEKRGDKGGGVSFQALGIDPRRWLRDPRREGEEEVGGAETIHIASGIDVGKFLEDINRVLGRTDLRQTQDPCAEQGEEGRQPQAQQPTRRLSEADRKQIAEAVKDARVDVWTGKDDKILRRVNVTMSFDVPEERRRRARGLQSGDVRFDLTIGGLNEEQTIKAPEGAQSLESLLGRFGGQVPGLGGGTGGGAQAPEGGAAAPQGEQSSEYLTCVQKAGQDVVKLQSCAELIGR